MKQNISRRDLGFLLPALAAVSAAAQQPAAMETMSSKAYDSTTIPYTGDANKKGRRFFFLQTHAGFKVEMHETILAAGMETHPPHQHVHEEIIVVVEGTFEVNMEGVKTAVPAGSVVVFGSNKVHNARNVGTTQCRYYVIELRGSEG
jgi:quercetin dioxygenase-like cupin family protein